MKMSKWYETVCVCVCVSVFGEGKYMRYDNNSDRVKTVTEDMRLVVSFPPPSIHTCVYVRTALLSL